MMRITKIYPASLLVLAATFAGVAWAAIPSGPEATAAKISATINHKPLALKHPEQVALMFLVAIADLQDDCVRHAGHACSMDELVNGVASKDGWSVGKLKFDPRTSDPNYTYTLTAGQNNWEAKATPKKPGLGGFDFIQVGFGICKNLYNAKGEASIASPELDSYTVEGDSFKKR